MFRVLVGYGIVGFAVLQIIEPIMHALHLPDVTLTYVVLALAVGFPISVVLAWAFDINEGKIERTAPAASHALKGIRLPLVLIGIGIFAAAPGVIWYLVLPGHLKRTTELVASTAPTPSIAVLPFADMSPGKDQEYFSDGIAEEILNGLAQNESLHVVGRTSSFSFRNAPQDLREVGHKLGVTHVLEGSVRREAGMVRVTAQLIDVATGYHVWSQTFSREVNSVLALEDEIANHVVGALKGKLLAGVRKERPSVDPRAYELYLRAHSLEIQFSADGVRQSIPLFREAVSLDPGLGQAWAWLAIALWWNVLPNSPAATDAVAAADKAVEVAPDLAAAHWSRALVRWYLQWDWSGAIDDENRAMAISPGDADALDVRCILERVLGHREASVAACREAIRLDPLSVAFWNQITNTYLASGEIGLARTANARAFDVSKDSRSAHENRCAIAVFANESGARELCSSLRDENRRLFWIALGAFEHDPARLDRSLAELIARMGERDPESIAEIHAWRGDKDKAFEWLDRAVARRAGLGEVKVDPLLKKLHGDPRWATLLKKMNLPLD